MHVCMQSEPSDVCFRFLFLFLFLFQGEEKEERSGRLTGEGLNTYLPTYLAVLVEEEEISILFFL